MQLLNRLAKRGRTDDDRHGIDHRLSVYRAETAPLLGYYRDELTTVDAHGTVAEVFTRALRVLQT
jgi:adenylate kinase